MKTYEILYQPVTVGGIERPKYNVYYYDESSVLESIEFHSKDGIDGSVREGYTIKTT